MIHNVPPRAAGNRPRGAAESQFEAWDMITGRAAPELGGTGDSSILSV